MRYAELLEGIDLDNGIYWFWYHPVRKELHHVDGTHTSAAAYELGLFPEGQFDEAPDLEDESIMKTAFDAGWVRGRCGKKGRPDSETGWQWVDDINEASELSLQGSPRNVVMTARDLAKKGVHFRVLYIDFDLGEEMDSARLAGARLAFFLKSGKVPGAMVMEGHGVDPRMVMLKTLVSIHSGLHIDRRHRPQETDLATNDLWDMWEPFKKELPREIAQMDPDEGVATKEFRQLTMRWAQARFKAVEKKLSKIPRREGGYVAHRVIKVPLEKFEQAKQSGATDLGIFWCFDTANWEASAIWGGSNPGVEVVIEAIIPDSSVDWFGTYLANMAWSSGDHESELRLKKGQPLKVASVATLDGDKQIDTSGIRFKA